MKVNLPALKRMLKVLDKVPSEKFDLNHFYSNDDVCGTAACACGWAGFDSWFISRGFKTMKGSSAVKYKSFKNFDAVENFFGLSKDDSLYLFHPEKYPDKRKYKKYVMGRIQSFINKKSKV